MTVAHRSTPKARITNPRTAPSKRPVIFKDAERDLVNHQKGQRYQGTLFCFQPFVSIPKRGITVPTP